MGTILGIIFLVFIVAGLFGFLCDGVQTVVGTKKKND